MGHRNDEDYIIWLRARQRVPCRIQPPMPPHSTLCRSSRASAESDSRFAASTGEQAGRQWGSRRCPLPPRVSAGGSYGVSETERTAAHGTRLGSPRHLPLRSPARPSGAQDRGGACAPSVDRSPDWVMRACPRASGACRCRVSGLKPVGAPLAVCRGGQRQNIKSLNDLWCVAWRSLRASLRTGGAQSRETCQQAPAPSVRVKGGSAGQNARTSGNAGRHVPHGPGVTGQKGAVRGTRAQDRSGPGRTVPPRRCRLATTENKSFAFDFQQVGGRCSSIPAARGVKPVSQPREMATLPAIASGSSPERWKRRVGVGLGKVG